MSKKIVAVLVLLLLLSLFNVFNVAFATQGAISITFDDGWKTNYDYAFPLLQAKGFKATFYVNTARIGAPYMTVPDLQTLQNSGHEIGSHGNNHWNYPTLTDSEMKQELEVSQKILRSWGLTANNFAYPNGARNAHTDSIVAQYYSSARSWGVEPYLIQLPTHQFLLPAFNDTSGSSVLAKLENMVDQVYSANSWAIIVFHNVAPDPGYWQPNTSNTVFASFLNYIQAKGVAVITVNQGLSNYLPSPTSTPSPSPTSTPSPSPTSTPSPSPTQNPTPSPDPTESPTPTAISYPSLSPTNTPSQTQIPTATPKPIPSLNPTLNPSPSSSPDDLFPTNYISTTIQAKADSGSIVDLVINGNITSSQISMVTIASNQTLAKTTFSFSLTGQSGTSGFGNVTIPKSTLPYETPPTIYIDDKPAQEQGYVQDTNNFYIWFTTTFSAHKISIEFVYTPNSTQSPSQNQRLPQEIIYGAIVAVTIIAIVTVVFALREREAKVEKSPRVSRHC